MSRIRLEVGSEPFPGLKLVQLLGRGGFADVWEGVNTRGERLAVKFMDSRNAASSVKEMRILQAIQKLRHRNVLQIHNVWSIPNFIVVSMELADGSLFDLVDVFKTEYRTVMPAALVLGYLRQAASALDHLNARQHKYDGRTVGFQHCDVKPSNLLLVGETVKLADFGLCTPTVALQSSYGRAGTLDFAAPEVHRGSLADTSDQYSLAVTYFYLRTATLPFPVTPADFSRAYSYSRPAPDLDKVHGGERKVLEKAMELEPTNRWPNCSMLIAALTDAVRKEDRESSHQSTEMRLAGSAH